MANQIIDKALAYLGNNVHIVGTGTDGIWKYRKYSDHTYEAWVDTSVNLGAGSAWMNGFYHLSVSSLSAPSFSQTVTSFGGYHNGQQLCMYCGHNASFQSYWFNATSGAQTNLAVHMEMRGTW